MQDAALLDLWAGTGDAESDVTAALLEAVFPDVPGHPDTWPLGLQQTRLMDARETIFGTEVVGIASCPACDADLEVAFALPEVRAEAPADQVPLEVVAGDPPHRVAFRLPTIEDLHAAASAESVEAARRTIAERCVVEASLRGRPIRPAELPEAVVAEMSRAMADADPQADTSLALSCPECGHPWVAGFDAGSFLGAEVRARVRRLLVDVHTMALAYGWGEGEVLALPEARRRAYLELILG